MGNVYVKRNLHSMRESASWKTMFCVLALMAGLAPLRADDPQPLQSTLAQLALLDKITGIGSLKFGASFDSFDKADLTYVGNPGVPTADYLYTTSDQITWGTLVPNGIALTFYYNELVGITLHFNETNATLISVKQAFVQKYGASTSDRQFSYAGAQNNDLHYFTGGFWAGTNISANVSLPDRIPPQSSEDFLTKKVDGAVQFIDSGLEKKLTQQKQDAMRSELLKGQNLDKIKADL
jgi:hypothetical protein